MADSLSAFLKRERTTRGWTQKELAEKSGVNQPTISDIERGATKSPDAGTRRLLAKTLGVSHLQLLIAAGEITEEEIGKAGAVGVIERDANSAREQIIARIRALPDWLNPEVGLEFAVGTLEAQARARK